MQTDALRDEGNRQTMTEIIIRNGRAETVALCAANEMARSAIKVCYLGEDSRGLFADAKATYSSLKEKLGGLIPHVESLEPGAFYFSNENAVLLSDHLQDVEFDLSERVTIARRLSDYLSELQRNGYKLSNDALEQIYVNPYTLELYLYDLTLVKESKLTFEEMVNFQRCMSSWMYNSLFLLKGNGVNAANILREMVEKLEGKRAHYRSFNSLFRDLSFVSLQLKKHGKCGSFPLDSCTPIVNRIQEAMRIRKQDLSLLMETHRAFCKGSTNCVLVTGRRGVGKKELIERFSNELPVDTSFFDFKIESTCTGAYEGVRILMNAVLRSHVCISEQKAKIFMSYLSVRFPPTSFIYNLIDEENRAHLGMQRALSIASACDDRQILEEISLLNDIVVGDIIFALHGFSMLDEQSKGLVNKVVTVRAIKRCLFIISDTHVDFCAINAESAVRLNVETLTAADIEGVLCSVFLKNRFDSTREIAQQIYNVTGGLQGPVIKIIDSAVQLGYIYQGDDGLSWLCSPGFFKKNYLDEKGFVIGNHANAGIAEDDSRVLRALALDSTGANFSEIEYVSELPAAKLEDVLLRLLGSSKTVKRWNEKYLILSAVRTEILESMPARVRRELNRRYIEYLTSNTSEYKAPDFVIRVSSHYLEEHSLGGELFLTSDLSYIRAFWAAAYVHYIGGDYPEARKYLSAANARTAMEDLADNEGDLIKQIELLDIYVCEKTGDLDRAEKLYTNVKGRAVDSVHKAEIAYSYVKILKAKREFQMAFDVGYDALVELGFEFPKRFRVLNAIRKYLGVRKKIEMLQPEFFYEHEETTSKSIKLVHKISAQIAVVCYQYHSLSTYVPVIILHSLELSLRHGATVEFSLYLMGYAYIKQMFPIKKKNERIREYYEISRKVQSRFSKDEYVEFFNDFINYGILQPWDERLGTVVSSLNNKYHQALASSEAETAGFFSGARFLLSLMNGENVGEVEKSVESAMPEIEKLSQGTPITIHGIIRSTVKELSSSEPTSLPEYLKYLNDIEADNSKNYTVLFCVSYCAVLVSFAKRRHLTALKYFGTGLHKYFLGASGLPYIVYFILYAFSSYSRILIGRRIAVTTSSRVREALLRIFVPIPFFVSMIFKRWSGLYPARYKHLYDYVRAESCLFLPIINTAAMARMIAAFEYADKNGFRHDALVIGIRICELKCLYTFDEFDTSSVERRVRRICKESGIHGLIKDDRDSLQNIHRFRENFFLPYPEDSLLKACEAATREISEAVDFRVLSIFEVRDEAVYEITRSDSRTTFTIERDIAESLPRMEQAFRVSQKGRTDQLDERTNWYELDGFEGFQSIFGIEANGDMLGYIIFCTDMPLDSIHIPWVENIRSKLKLLFLHRRYRREQVVLDAEEKLNKERIAHINHEIRTPINGIVSLTEKLLSVYDNDAQSEEIEGYIEHIANCARQLVKIHRDMVSLQELDSERFSLCLEETDLHEAILTPFNALREIYFKKGIVLNAPRLDALPKTVLADGAKISQIVYNLLHNSFKYTERGSVTGTVEFGLNKNSLTLDITIRDTGLGIAPDTARKLKTNGATTVLSPASIKGTGIGLYVVGRYCELMGGNLLIDTSVQQGAKISALICVEKVESDSNVSQFANNDGTNLKGIRILCVDDDEINQIAYKAKFSDTGCVLTTAMNGWQALEIMKRQDFDVILMDYDMPGGNGVEIAGKAKELFGSGCPPIVCVSAYDQATIIEQNPDFTSVCSGYFEKITDRDSLIKYIANISGRRFTPADVDNNIEKHETTIEFNWINVDDFERAYSKDIGTGIHLIERFIDRNVGLLPQIVNLLKIQEKTQVVSLLHQLKGQSKNVGAERLAKEAQLQMQIVESERSSSEIIYLLESSCLDEKLNATISELKEWASILAFRIPSIDPTDQEKQINEIDKLLEMRSLEVLGRISELVRSKLFLGDEVEECLEDVKSAVQDKKFDIARERIVRFKGGKHAAAR